RKQAATADILDQQLNIVAAVAQGAEIIAFRMEPDAVDRTNQVTRLQAHPLRGRAPHDGIDNHSPAPFKMAQNAQPRRLRNDGTGIDSTGIKTHVRANLGTGGVRQSGKTGESG